MKKTIELLAPAGDLARLKTAVRYGADAVYLGGKRFSLRSRASNFELEDIAEGVRFAREYGAHVHVTVNIIPHEDDFDGLDEYLRQLESIGVHAVIVASLTIVRRVKTVAPKLEVHLSTQMSSTNSQAVRFYQRLGADRVVLARECTMDQIRQICGHSEVPIETFIHGGMCVNYSGRCSLSNAMTLRDANRGGCAQSCRWRYHLYQGTQELSDDNLLFSMGSKDLMAADYVRDMIDAGVASLKIEGRMKSAYYIAVVVRAYRQLIDWLLEHPEEDAQPAILEARRELMRAENRPACLGFLAGIPGPQDHLYDNAPSRVTHDFLAQVLDYDSLRKQALIEVRNHFALGEALEAFGPHLENTTFVLETMTDEEGTAVEVANKPMQRCWINTPAVLHPYDLIRRKEQGR